MKLLDIESIRSQLDNEYISLEPILSGMRLVPTAVNKESVDSCQHILNVRFPLSFLLIVTRFDFGNFTIGPVAFCQGGDYFTFLAKINTAESHQLSEVVNLPEGAIIIGNSDQFALLLDTTSGHILSVEHDGIVSEAVKVADDFELFLRGLGTAFVLRDPEGGNEMLAREIASQVSADRENRFWQWVAA